MRISQKLDYASRAMVHLARKHEGQKVVRAEDIAQNEAIPLSFLAQILHELKRFGLVTSRRGKTGGWQIAKAPDEVTLLTILEALEPESLGQQMEGLGESGPVIGKAWEAVRASTREILARQTLESLASNKEPMFYI